MEITGGRGGVGGGIRSTGDAAKWRNKEINAVVNATFEAINNDPQLHLATGGRTSVPLQVSKAKRKGQKNNLKKKNHKGSVFPAFYLSTFGYILFLALQRRHI